MTATRRQTPIAVDELQGARVYANAVWKLAVEQDISDALLEEVDTLVDGVIEVQARVRQFFQTSAISKERRAQVLRNTFQGRCSDLMFSFLLTLNRHDRLGLIWATRQCLHELRDQHLGRVAVLVRAAVPVQPNQLEPLRESIQRRLGLLPDITTEVVPELLGGLWVRVGDVVYDHTVRWNLQQLHEQIMARSSHET